MMESGKNESATQLAKVLWYYNLIPDTHTLNQKIICPFHGDVNPSLLVDLTKGSWFCFGCNEAGDAKKFVELMEAKYSNANSLQACRTFNKILKSKKCSNIHINPKQAKTNRKTSKQLYDEAYDYYRGLKTYDWEETVDVEEIDECRTYMKQRGFDPSTLNKCKAKATYNWSYGLIFPMLDNGKFKGWVCRTMREQVEKRRKYLYNAGFSRATTLVGNYGKEEYVFVVEGYMDRLRFIQNGVDNVVAILGWKMSAQQKKKLDDAGVVHVISALDNDVCGKKGTKYLQTLFGKENVTRFQYLKGIKDPGEMEPQQFKRMYKRTIKLYEKNKTKGDSKRCQD